MKTNEFARKRNKSCLHLHSCQRDAAKTIKTFPEDNSVQTSMLPVQGPADSLVRQSSVSEGK
jgi:hypothetical protein